MGGQDDGAWSRALMASSGIAAGNEVRRHLSAEAHEAGAASLTVARLQQLAVTRDAAVREVIARRADCPMGVLATLAHDRVDDVRIAAAANPSAVRAVFEHLARDRNPSVVKAVIRNPSTPAAIVEVLAFHKREEVRRVAARRLDELTRAPGEEGPSDAGALPAEIADHVPAATTPWLVRKQPEPDDVTRARHEPRALAPRPTVGRGPADQSPPPRAAGGTGGGWAPRAV